MMSEQVKNEIDEFEVETKMEDWQKSEQHDATVQKMDNVDASEVEGAF